MLFLIIVRKNKLSINNVYYLFGEKVKVRSWFCTVSNSRDRHKIQNYRKMGEHIGKYLYNLGEKKSIHKQDTKI